MSLKTRIEKLEKVLAKDAPPENVVEATVIVVRSREEAEALRAAELRDSPQDNARPVPGGPVRVVVKQTVEAKDWLAARRTLKQDNGG